MVICLAGGHFLFLLHPKYNFVSYLNSLILLVSPRGGNGTK